MKNNFTKKLVNMHDFLMYRKIKACEFTKTIYIQNLPELRTVKIKCENFLRILNKLESPRMKSRKNRLENLENKSSKIDKIFHSAEWKNTLEYLGYEFSKILIFNSVIVQKKQERFHIIAGSLNFFFDTKISDSISLKRKTISKSQLNREIAAFQPLLFPQCADYVTVECGCLKCFFINTTTHDHQIGLLHRFDNKRINEFASLMLNKNVATFPIIFRLFLTNFQSTLNLDNEKCGHKLLESKRRLHFLVKSLQVYKNIHLSSCSSFFGHHTKTSNSSNKTPSYSPSTTDSSVSDICRSTEKQNSQQSLQFLENFTFTSNHVNLHKIPQNTFLPIHFTYGGRRFCLGDFEKYNKLIVGHLRSIDSFRFYKTAIKISNSYNKSKCHWACKHAIEGWALSKAVFILLRKIFKGIFGAKNAREYSKKIQAIFRLKKWESLDEIDFTKKISLNRIRVAIRDNRPHRERIHRKKQFASNFLFSVCSKMITPLVFRHFYATECGWSGKKLLFFPKNEYFKAISEKSRYLTENFKKLESKYTINMFQCGKLRFIPKPDGFRPIINFSGSRKIKAGNLCLKTRHLHKILSFEAEKLCKNSYLNRKKIISDFFKYGKSVSRRGVAYVLKTDIKKCYDNIPHEKLKPFIKKIFKHERYTIFNYTIIDFSQERPKSLRKYNVSTDPTSLLKSLSDYKNESDSLIKDGKIDEYTRHDLEKLLCSIIFENYVQHKTEIYHQKKGIPQGSIISSLICSIYFEFLDNLFLNDVVITGRIFRYIDDFLVISSNEDEILRFITESRKLHEYGVFINYEKIETNAEITKLLTKPNNPCTKTEETSSPLKSFPGKNIMRAPVISFPVIKLGLFSKKEEFTENSYAFQALNNKIFLDENPVYNNSLEGKNSGLIVDGVVKSDKIDNITGWSTDNVKYTSRGNIFREKDVAGVKFTGYGNLPGAIIPIHQQCDEFLVNGTDNTTIKNKVLRISRDTSYFPNNSCSLIDGYKNSIHQINYNEPKQVNSNSSQSSFKSEVLKCEQINMVNYVEGHHNFCLMKKRISSINAQKGAPRFFKNAATFNNSIILEGEKKLKNSDSNDFIYQSSTINKTFETNTCLESIKNDDIHIQHNRYFRSDGSIILDPSQNIELNSSQTPKFREAESKFTIISELDNNKCIDKTNTTPLSTVIQTNSAFVLQSNQNTKIGIANLLNSETHTLQKHSAEHKGLSSQPEYLISQNFNYLKYLARRKVYIEFCGTRIFTNIFGLKHHNPRDFNSSVILYSKKPGAAIVFRMHRFLEYRLDVVFLSKANPKRFENLYELVLLFHVRLISYFSKLPVQNNFQFASRLSKTAKIEIGLFIHKLNSVCSDLFDRIWSKALNDSGFSEFLRRVKCSVIKKKCSLRKRSKISYGSKARKYISKYSL